MAVEIPRDTSERRDGPTPNGGAYSIALYSNRAGRPCVRAEATRIEIHEYDEAGNSLFRTLLEVQG